MTCYIVSYDLRKPGRNYDSLYEAIKAYGTWARINESLWAIMTINSALQVVNNLENHIDENDRLFVIQSGSKAAWTNAICKDEWLKEHL